MVPDTNSWCSLGFAEPSAAYTSATRQVRHLTEGWMAEHGVRPACPADRLPPLPNNTRLGDFRCAACGDPTPPDPLPFVIPGAAQRRPGTQRRA